MADLNIKLVNIPDHLYKEFVNEMRMFVLEERGRVVPDPPGEVIIDVDMACKASIQSLEIVGKILSGGLSFHFAKK